MKSRPSCASGPAQPIQRVRLPIEGARPRASGLCCGEARRMWQAPPKYNPLSHRAMLHTRSTPTRAQPELTHQRCDHVPLFTLWGSQAMQSQLAHLLSCNLRAPPTKPKSADNPPAIQLHRDRRPLNGGVHKPRVQAPFWEGSFQGLACGEKHAPRTAGMINH